MAEVAAPHKAPTARGGRPRRIIVVVLVVLFAILVPVTTLLAWTHRTVLNTSAYVDTIAPISRNPAVVNAVSKRVTDEIYTALQPQTVIADALPPKAAFLAAPIANGAKGYVADGVSKVIESNAFQQLWIAANRFAHQQLVDLLRGNTKIVKATNGQIVLNLAPLLAAVVGNLGDFAASVVGHPVTLPQVSSTELPAAACTKISTALSRPLSSTCGEIVIFRAKNLATARHAVRVFDRATLALVILTPLLGMAALLLSRRRRRTALQLTISAMVGLVVMRRLGFYLQNQLVDPNGPGDPAARSAIVHQLLHGLFTVALWMLVVGALIVVALWVTGPYKSAVAVRRSSSQIYGAAREAVRGGEARPSPAVVFIHQHYAALRWAGLGVAVLLMLAVNLNWWSFLIIAVVLALYELGLYRLRPPSVVTLPEQPRVGVSP